MSRIQPARALALVALSGLFATPQYAQLTTETVIPAASLSRPIWAGSRPGDDRIFVAEQHTGEVHIYDQSGAFVSLFLDVGSVQTQNEQGLLGFAFHPKFEQTGHVFVNYTQGGSTIIERWTVSAGDPNVADPASRLVFLTQGQPFTNHNAGHIEFSPVDGYLYIAFGDGGSGNDPACRGQNPNALLGKMLRIDVDTPDAVAGTNYSIPADNPFIGVARDEIWAFGVRNPYRFSFDTLNGDMYIGDVGQNAEEEIDYEPAGAGGRNYGWPVMEGQLCNGAGVSNCSTIAPPGCFDPGYTGPIHVYDTGCPPFGGGDGCAVIGGVVYRGCQNPGLQGTYFFADNGSGRYWSLEVSGGVAINFAERTGELSSAGTSPTSFGVDGDGEVLIVNQNGLVSRIIPTSPPAIADCDANGLDDTCEIATYAWADMDASGTVDACEDFSADTDHVCASTGGRQEWSLHAGAGFGSNSYWILGSLAGTAPGIPFGGITLPLNPDFYFALSAELFNNGFPFETTFGVLDGAGNASAAFNAPAGLVPPSAVGLTANHAYVVFNGALQVVKTSNYTGVEFRP